MIGISVPVTKKAKTIKEKLPTTFTAGCTLEDLKDELIKNNTKFEIRFNEEYYRRKTKSMPRHIDICCGYCEYKNYNEFMKSNEYSKLANVPIKKINLGEKASYNGEEFMKDFFNNVTRKVVIIQLKKITLDDTETPRDYSLLIDREDMVNELTDINYDEWY